MRWFLAVAGILVLAVCLVGGVLIFGSRQAEHSQKPNLEPLANSLKQRIDDILGGTSFPESTVELSVMRSQLESEVARVKYLATRLGGSAAIKQPATGASTDLIAEIPVENRKSFIDAVTDGFKDLPEPSPSDSAIMCVVTVQIKVQS